MQQKHGGHYKIYNLCAERHYDLTAYFPNVVRFGFKDHNPCNFSMIAKFCASVDEYLSADPDNVVAVRCILFVFCMNCSFLTSEIFYYIPL